MGKKNKKSSGFDELKEIDRLLGGSEDTLEIYFDDDEGGKKKKKKKGKDKDKDKKKSDSWSKSNEKDYKDSLKELSKKQLRKKAEALGVDLDYVDKDDKKALRKAIMKAVSESKRAESIRGDKPKKEKSAGLVATSSDKITTKPPFYLDEDSKDFVIGNALDAEDMTIFQGMQSLGKMRQSKRSDDGFGELMDKITKKLLETPTEKEVIDVEYKVVEDVKALPPKEVMKDMVEAVELTPEEVEKVSKDVDAALATLHDSRKQQSGQSKKKKNR